jgi:hypothetical protein
LACAPAQPRAPCPIKAAWPSLLCASPLSSASPTALHRFAPPSIVPSRAPPTAPHLDSPLGGIAGANQPHQELRKDELHTGCLFLPLDTNRSVVAPYRLEPQVVFSAAGRIPAASFRLRPR